MLQDKLHVFFVPFFYHIPKDKVLDRDLGQSQETFLVC